MFKIAQDTLRYFMLGKALLMAAMNQREANRKAPGARNSREGIS